MSKVFIIAEAGVNHNGSIDIAKRLIELGSEAGVDAVKFQSFKAEKLVTRSANKAQYQKVTTGSEESQFSMIKKLELDYDKHQELMDYAASKQVLFLSSAFDLDSIDLLITLGLNIFKIPSGEITNLPYLRKIALLRRKVILSSGMSTLAEIEQALQVLKDHGTTDITVLHCNTEYPTPMQDVNLRAMLTIKEAFQVKVGYSDHTLGIEVPIAAVALGATVIEKHFTLDKNMEGPDHRASLEPYELKAMVTSIRNIEQAVGDGVKKPSTSELKNILIARKSLVAAKAIQQGELFTTDNMTVKRPADGLSPMLWDEVLGKSATRSFQEDEMIEL